jgi:hypothetical protein
MIQKKVINNIPKNFKRTKSSNLLHIISVNSNFSASKTEEKDKSSLPNDSSNKGKEISSRNNPVPEEKSEK